MKRANVRVGPTPRRPAPTAGTTGDQPSATIGSESPGRVVLVDAARGFAVAMMIAYHFCFDLTYYGWAHWPMLDDARWIAWRSTIVGCFVFVVGVSLALRDDRDRRRGATAAGERSFVRRWAQVAASALLVTIGSAVLFPKTFIYFGVLHFVAVASWLCRRAPRLGGRAVLLGGVALAAGLTVSSSAFDPKWIDWIGFAANKPLTEDYVPLVPWIGVTLLGCGTGAAWARRRFAVQPAVANAWAALPRWIRAPLVGAGRRSLSIYLLHQPILLGAMGAVKQVVG